jgi:hypothetical protein
MYSRKSNAIENTFLNKKIMPNELRIDAAGGVKVKTVVVCAAASVQVELSRIWKKKPGGSGENISRTQCPPIKDRSGEYFT